MNEEEFIQKIRKNSSKMQAPLLVGIGDDTAVYKPSATHLGLFATDMLCEGIHFLPDEDPKLVGRKALAVNISDIAAMGAKPTLAVLAIAFPNTRGTQYGLDLVAGAQSLADEYGISLCGGDTNRSRNDVSVCVSILGESRGKGAILRSGAKVGDAILVSGKLGGSFDSRKHLLFKPRVQEALYLNEHYTLHSMADISDGLARDLGHIVSESNCGAVLNPNAIPVSDNLTHLTREEQLQHALGDGEDFELVFTLPSKQADELLAKQKFTDCVFSRIGSIIEKKGLYWNSLDTPITTQGYTHLW